MKSNTHRLWLLFIFSTISAKEIDIPLCPTSPQYFPQNLPLHCKMSPNVNVYGSGGRPMIPIPPQGLPMIPAPFQGPVPAPFPGPVPAPFKGPVPAPFPGLVPAPFPGPVPAPFKGPVPAPFPAPMAVPGQFPGPMPIPVPPVKLPVIVMPFYSPEPMFRKPKPNDKDTRSDSDKDTDTSSSSDTSRSSDTSSEREFWGKKQKNGWKRGLKRNPKRFHRKLRAKRKRYQKRDYLTPILQYVTKDGYVIYEKKISKGQARDLNEGNITAANINKDNDGRPKKIRIRIDGIVAGIISEKNKDINIKKLNDDKNIDNQNEKQVQVKNIKKQRNKNNQRSDEYSSEEGFDEKLNENSEKVNKPKTTVKRV